MTKDYTFAHEIYAILSKVTDKSLNQAYDLGMIKKEDLIVGKTYVGYCRNADEAVWTDENCFEYQRAKFGSTYTETIVYPSDDEGYDIFVPIVELTI